ncbi:MAG: FHA domain-containing protein [Acaryochloris sp. SU_5_25]|nr:FHA domain-containing protein [Acaryochloris sp. SU_5_25]
MTELILEWVEEGRSRSERIQPNQPSKNSGTTRLGRDPQRCDIVFTDNSVSGIQAEIFYHAGYQAFYLRSLRDTNPPIVNGQPITTGEVPLSSGNTITLGRIVLNARVSTSGGLPPTEISPLGGLPPTAVNPPYAGSASAPPLPSYPSPNPTPYYQSSLPSEPQGPKIWVWIIAGVLVIGGGALAWPYVSDFLGLSKEPTVSQADSKPDSKPDSKSDSNQEDRDQSDTDGDSSSKPRRDSFEDKMADLAAYTHPSGLFKIEIPRTWERKDTSKAGEVIIRWTDQKTESSIVMDLFKSQQQLGQEELGDLARRFVTNAFSEQPDFQVGEPKTLDNGVVELGWEFSTSNDRLLGATYTQQSNNTVSVVSILVLRSDFEKVKPTFKDILSSYSFDPSVDIP